MPRKIGSFYAEVGRRIRKARADAKVTQEHLAEELSLTRTSVTNIEKGRQKLLLHTFVRIADVLGVPVSSLLPVDTRSSHELTDILERHTKAERDWVNAAVGEDR